MPPLCYAAKIFGPLLRSKNEKKIEFQEKSRFERFRLMSSYRFAESVTFPFFIAGMSDLATSEEN